MKQLFATCAILLTVSCFSAFAQPAVPGTRGLESSHIDSFVSAFQAGDLQGVAGWFDSQGYQDLAGFVRDRLSQSPSEVARALAYPIFKKQQQDRADRYQFILLQTVLEETVMAAQLENAVFIGATELSAAENQSAGHLRGLTILPGDTLVQIGAGYMSSHFIAHSQSLPGLASHGLMVSTAGKNPEVIEALIEDGTNRRPPTKSQLARMFVLSAPSESERAQIAASTSKFIDDMRIPFIQEGAPSNMSPLFYDATMNPDRKRDGYYFCTALVQEIHLRSGTMVNPYPEDMSNWNFLIEGSVERDLYLQLGILKQRVPAPGDALLNPKMALRGEVVDVDGLRKSRRLRAVVDAFFDILKSDPKTREEMHSAFVAIPVIEVRKKQILEAFDRFATQPELKVLLGEGGAKSVKDARDQLEKQLPQAANLRQIAFFFIMNSVVQDKALAVLEEFETRTLKRHATPGEFRAAATSMWVGQLSTVKGEMQKIREAISVFGKSIR